MIQDRATNNERTGSSQAHEFLFLSRLVWTSLGWLELGCWPHVQIIFA